MKITFKDDKILTLGGKTFSLVPTKYNVNISQVQNGTITSDKQTAFAGETITLSYTADTGYDLQYFTVNGIQIVGNTFTMPSRSVTVSGSFADMYNPYNLPNKTLRVKVIDGFVPSVGEASYTLVDEDENIYDVYSNSNDWSGVNTNSWKVILGGNLSTVTTLPRLEYASNLIRIESLDLSGATDLNYFLNNNTTIESVKNINTTNITNMYSAFNGCTSLKKLPMFDVSKVTLAIYTFRNCINAETGIIDMYQVLSNKSISVQKHISTFTNCGTSTTTGAAELAQIPSDWK